MSRGDARSEILRRIAEATEGTSSCTDAERLAALDRLPRQYRKTSALSRAELVALLSQRLRDYDAYVEECASAEVASTVERMLLHRDLRRIVLPAGFPPQWLPQRPDLIAAQTLDIRGLAACGGVLTGATLAIAETGTLVLQGVPGQGRRADTLVPDYHLCVVRKMEIVSTVPEAFAWLETTKRLPTTFVSGPSATADIEMTRIKGVHGPRVLDVLLAG